MFFTKKNSFLLENKLTPERAGDVENPGRGWYRIYSFVLEECAEKSSSAMCCDGNDAGGEKREGLSSSERCDGNDVGGQSCEDLLPPVRYPGETVALVRIDIGAFREKELSEQVIARMRGILQAFVGIKMEMLVRIVYDTQGKGMENEPGSFSLVLTHIRQLGGILKEFAEHILVFQGLCVGSWGEMHTSKFLTPKHISQMTEAFVEATEGKIPLAFRTPVLYRKIVSEEKWKAVGSSSIGFFDDAILADETHMGTFGKLPKEEAGWENAWQPQDEILFLEQALQHVPFGGEAVNGMEDRSAEEIVAQLAKLHVSYLNCIHDPVCLERWKNMPAPEDVPGSQFSSGERSEDIVGSGDSCSLYDWIGAHLGYRFIVKKAELVRKGKEYRLSVTIANTGFACCTKEIKLTLLAGDAQAAVLVVQPEQLLAGSENTFRFELSAALLEESNLPLTLSMEAGGRMICFANEGAAENLLLGYFSQG